MATIQGPELVEHVEAVTGGPASFNHRARLIRAFWRWCAKEPRTWCRATVVEHLDPKEERRGGIGVLTAAECRKLLRSAEDHYPDCVTAAECRKLLRSAEDHYPDCVPGFALALFTGMRKAELGRLTPEDFSKEGVSVPAASAKTKRRRFIEMTPPLKAWLAAYPIVDTVLPANWSRKERAVRRLAGWRVWSDLVPTLKRKPALKAKPPDELPKWPENALRHTHASVAIALGKPLETLIFEFGHSGGVATLKAHYAGIMPKKEALKILAIGPKRRKLNGGSR